MEPLDDRTLLTVTFKFNIIDPNNAIKPIRAQLQALANAAGQEWSTHLIGNATLEYDISLTNAPLPGGLGGFALGASKTAEIIRTDPLTGEAVWQLGTALELKDGKDRNGATKADGGITLSIPGLKQWYFETNPSQRSAAIPEGYYDGYTILLHEMAHSLGFASTRNPLGTVPKIGKYTFDEHVNVNAPGFMSFGKGGFTFDPVTGNVVVDPSADNAMKVYNGSVSLEIGNPNRLGAGRFVDTGVIDQFGFYFNTITTFQDDLSSDLMGGVFNPGDRRTISRLDLAMLKDAETPVDISTDETPEGLYVVNGTGLSDNIELSLSNGTLLIRVNNAVTSFTPEQSNKITSIVLNGLNGNDTIRVVGAAPGIGINGGAGADVLFGGPKSDNIGGGGGNDLIYGGGGGDLLRGGDGNDILYGQGGTDRMFGDGGSDHLDGGIQSDRMNGGSGSDTVVGGTEDDSMNGDAGNDLLSGAGGKDRMNGGIGADQFYGGAGNDSVDYTKHAAGVIASIDGSPDDGIDGERDNIFDSENILGSSFDDRLIGSETNNQLLAGAGNDTVEGGGGNDTLEGNNGNDVLGGGGGHDSLIGGDGNDRLAGGTGVDHLLGDAGEDDLVSADGAVDTVNGGDGSDTLTGDSIDQLTDVETTQFVAAAATSPAPLASRRITFT